MYSQKLAEEGDTSGNEWDEYIHSQWEMNIACGRTTATKGLGTKILNYEHLPGF